MKTLAMNVVCSRVSGGAAWRIFRTCSACAVRPNARVQVGDPDQRLDDHASVASVHLLGPGGEPALPDAPPAALAAAVALCRGGDVEPFVHGHRPGLWSLGFCALPVVGRAR